MRNKTRIVIVSVISVLLFTACSTTDKSYNVKNYEENYKFDKNSINNPQLKTEVESKPEGNIKKESSSDDVQAEGNVSGIDLSKNYITLGEASTRLIDKSENRVHNINLAIDAIKNIVIKSGQEFSFNTVVGERTMERGYLEAPAILYEERVSEVGGGICQVSSTIYQAAKNSGLEIIERNQHNKPVNYIAEGMDACVEYGRLDLRFKNNTDNTIILKTSCDGEYVYASIEINS